MKRILVGLIWQILYFGIEAQTPFNAGLHTTQEHPASNMTQINGDYYFFTTSQDHWLPTYLNKYTSNGTLGFRSHGTPGTMFESLDHNLIVYGRNNVCDVVDTSMIRCFIRKVDSNGNVLFNTLVNMYPNGYWDSFRTVLQYSDSSYFAFSDSIMFRFSKNGALITKTSLTFDQILSAVLLQNGSIVISRGNSFGSGQLLTIDTLGTILNSRFVHKTQFSLKSYASGQRFFGKDANGKLYKFSNSLDSLANYSITPSGCKDFLVDKDTVYAINQTDFVRLDSSFNPISVSTCTTQQMFQHAMTKNANLIGVLSGCSRGNQWQGPLINFTSLGVFNKSTSNNFTLDAELAQMTVDSAFSLYTAPNTYFHDYLRAKVKIKNKGSQTINSINLSCYLDWYICGYEFYKESFNELAILSGDSAIITTSFIHDLITNTLAINGNTLTSNWCLYVTIPNAQNDRNSFNDAACLTYTNVIIGVDEYVENEKSAKVFPNPFMESFSVQSETEIKNLELFDAVGLSIKKILIKAKTIEIDTEDLPGGIYFLRVETEKGLVVKKVIKN